MSNNKQMKLYTEEQVIALTKSAFTSGQNHNSFIFEEELKSITPIKLPSDKEIDRESEVLYPININKGGSMWMPSRYDIDKNNRQEGFFDGAKWMRDKIGGNNEQQ